MYICCFFYSSHFELKGKEKSDFGWMYHYMMMVKWMEWGNVCIRNVRHDTVTQHLIFRLNSQRAEKNTLLHFFLGIFVVMFEFFLCCANSVDESRLTFHFSFPTTWRCRWRYHCSLKSHPLYHISIYRFYFILFFYSSVFIFFLWAPRVRERKK
jgi:hypothetical protein